MAKIAEKKAERTFTLEVNEKELQWVARALRLDTTNDDENGNLYAIVAEYGRKNDVELI